MFRTIKEGLGVYKRELGRYRCWLYRLRSDFPRLFRSGRFGVLELDDADRERYTHWNAKLRGMILSLGLTKKEVIMINEEVGLGPPLATT
ncbi:MAG: hypothetical protein KJI72_00470 [Patescibacteria group bacterium]|nr:hypothetical protein [Patescibacteria group bacterium]